MVTDCVEMGIGAAAEHALEVVWKGTDPVWLSFDVDYLDAAFVPGTGWPDDCATASEGLQHFDLHAPPMTRPCWRLARPPPPGGTCD
jgi:arginase family enzyme